MHRSQVHVVFCFHRGRGFLWNFKILSHPGSSLGHFSQKLPESSLEIESIPGCFISIPTRQALLLMLA